jgi:apolipoprotein N-acyltransferase
VFVPSVALTAVIGLFLALTWSSARSRRALGFYWGATLAVHLLWWRLPDLHGILGDAGRWLTIVWIGAAITGVLLIIPFAVAAIGQRFLVRRAAARFLNGLRLHRRTGRFPQPALCLTPASSPDGVRTFVWSPLDRLRKAMFY